MKTMKAVRMHAYGGPEVLKYEDAPLPRIEREDVLIRVHAAGVNPVDWKIREGYLKGRIQYELPLVLGWDVSGVVEEVGPDVVALRPGDEVYARPDITRNGAYAEYIAVRATEVSLKPRALDHIQAAAVPLAALTAWQSLFDAAGLSMGQRVLIHAAAGGVGSFALQLAKTKSAYAIGTASARHLELLRELGADEVIDYRERDFEDAVADVDVVFDTIGGDTQRRSWKVLKRGGVLVSIIDPPSAETARAYGVRGAYVFVEPKAEELAEIGQLVDIGEVRPVIESVLPLEDAAEAHRLSETGHVAGKIVLRVTPPSLY